MENMLSKYGKNKAVQCKHCGFVQLFTGKNSFRCFECDKSAQVMTRNPTAINIKILYHSNNITECSNWVQNYKETQGRKRNI